MKNEIQMRRLDFPKEYLAQLVTETRSVPERFKIDPQKAAIALRYISEEMLKVIGCTLEHVEDAPSEEEK